MTESQSHPVFGDLRWEAESAWWFTQVRLQSGEWLDVVLHPGDEEPLPFTERAAGLYCRAMEAEREIVREATTKGLHELYDQWRREEDPELTAEELTDQLSLAFIRVDTVGPVTLSFEMGDVFGGHSVDVTVDEQLRVTGVNLVG